MLDIGCLYTNNLIPFIDRGAKAYGVEINSDMVELAKKSAETWCAQVEISEGNNCNLPFDDEFFDIILSVNTIHYEDGKLGIEQALSEIKRVSKKKCSIFNCYSGIKTSFSHKCKTH